LATFDGLSGYSGEIDIRAFYKASYAYRNLRWN